MSWRLGWDELKAAGGPTGFTRTEREDVALPPLPEPPPGWKPPKRPDMMTRVHKGRGGRKV